MEITALRDEQRRLIQTQVSALAKHLHVDLAGESQSVESERLVQEVQKRLDVWSTEFSEEFQAGIRPQFDAQKIRRFASWWNWAREDLIKLYHDAQLGKLGTVDAHPTSQRMLRIANRLDESTTAMIGYIHAQIRNSTCPNDSLITLNDAIAAAVPAESLRIPPVFRYTFPLTAPQTLVTAQGQIEFKEVPRVSPFAAESYPELLLQSFRGEKRECPFVHIRARSPTAEWILDARKTERLMATFLTGISHGLSFAGQTILVTGAGRGSIGAEVIKGLLMGGARVIATTSRTLASAASFFQDLYSDNCSKGSELTLVPFNQGSARDCEAIIDHIYSDSGLGLNIDTVIPFAAISEIGIEVDDLGGRSELAHRLMMTNVLRLLGRIVSNKRRRRIDTQPTQVILPLSPNTGTFGGDGLYSASKLGLESLLNRFGSEHWSDYITVCGALIGWTRGTGLMHGNDHVAPMIESKGALTFSQHEMAFNVIVLATAEIAQMCETEAILADLNGGLHTISGLSEVMATGRAQLSQQSQIQKAIMREDDQEKELLKATDGSSPETSSPRVSSRIAPKIGFPSLPDYEQSIRPLDQLQGMVDLGSTIVVVGLSELGPWGSARTRWEMESRGNLSPEGYAELAWMMNLIKHVDRDSQGEHYCGWVDTKTGEQVEDLAIQSRYGEHILARSGIRFVEPGEYDPAKKEHLHEIAVEEDLPEFETNEATAQALKLRLGDAASIQKKPTSDDYAVQIKRGAHILVPKATPAECSVAGQLPSGWSPGKYGIPEDIVHQVDPVTLYSLCCAAEALYSAGIIDSLEIFEHIHVSEVGNMLGTCIGGSTKTRHMYKDEYLDRSVQGDIIQETFLNASATWINMLLLGASGPIKTPNGTCATGVESLEIGCESILAGKTKLCLVGGVDDLQEEEAHGFAKIKATANTQAELAKGRSPQEMSRPTAESRAGFVEAQGCGLQIITTAELALEMGLPIYAVVASTTMAADKISRSLPAPGQGVLTFARESARASSSPLLSVEYRRGQMQACIRDIERWRASHIHDSSINAAADARIRAVRRLFGNDLRSQDPEISPMRASLAVWGLIVDDIDVVSLHATSTGANDKNEPAVVHRQMSALGRTPGHPLLAVCQKALTGHPKGAAASWMLNGCIQSLETGIVPGNRNADSIDERLRNFDHLVFPTEAIQTREVKAFLLNSFGFGQKGAQMIGIAPKYLFSALSRDEYQCYAAKVTKRKRFATRAWIKAVNSNEVFKARATPPYQPADETTVLKDPLARTSLNSALPGGELSFDGKNLHPGRELSDRAATAALTKASAETLIGAMSGSNSSDALGVGIDVEDIASFTSCDNEFFVGRNYTAAEQTQCAQAQFCTRREAFAANWTAKEAVFKSLGIKSKGAAAPMKDIEILMDADGNVSRVVVSCFDFDADDVFMRPVSR